MADGCVFCAIAQGSAPASIVCENDYTERPTLDSYAAILRSHLE
jgi:diadenosine tetraphosphate (Ap4A) HIT family hydrolase